MKHTEVADWRVWKAARVASATGKLPGGDQPQPGDFVYVVTQTDAKDLGPLFFITPSPTALALSASIRAAHRARDLRTKLSWDAAVSDGSRPLSPGHLGACYDFFEAAMSAVIFSYQALESLANQIIDEGLKGTMTLHRRNGPVDSDAGTIERKATTEEKWATVLPQVLKKPPIKGRSEWAAFQKLKELRDATIHLKSASQYKRGGLDTTTLYHGLLATDPLTHPKAALGMIRYFLDVPPNEWLCGAEALL